MKDGTLSRAFRVTNQRAAAALADPLRRRLVLSLARNESSLADLARSTGIDLKRLHYHVTALKRFGLVVVTRTQRRAGRPLKFYRAVSEAFFVSRELDVAPPHHAVQNELRASLDALSDPSVEGVLYHLSDTGEPRMRAVGKPPGESAHGELWLTLQLSRSDAARLAKDVEACVRNFAAHETSAAKPYLVHFAFAPRTVAAKRTPR